MGNKEAYSSLLLIQEPGPEEISAGNQSCLGTASLTSLGTCSSSTEEVVLTQLDGLVMILDLVGKERKEGGWKRRGGQAMEAKA